MGCDWTDGDRQLVERLERYRGTSRRPLARICGLVLLVGALGPHPASAAKKKKFKLAAKEGKVGRPLLRPYDGRKKPLKSGALVIFKRFHSDDAHVSESDYRELSNASMALLKRYDPAKHYFVGTGRDPAPIIAFLQNLGGRDLATSFPASGGLPSFGGTQADWLDASAAKMSKYFRKLIPSHVPKSGRNLVLLDVTNSGKTPYTLAPAVKKWLKSQGSSSKVVKLAFTSFPNEMPRGVKAIDTAPFPRVDDYMHFPYEGVVNEFPQHSIDSRRLRDLKPRRKYAKYRKAVLRRMKRDRTLDKFLRKLKGTVGLPL